MNSNKDRENAGGLEVKDLAPDETWFDPIGIRFFVNSTKKPILLGFGHNVRAVEMIVILDPKKAKEKNADVDALEGEIIEEEV